jgi:hypothetical protein
MAALPDNYDFYHRCAVQKALNEKTKVSPPLKIDGAFGPASIGVLKTFQKQCNVPQTGVYDAATQALLEPFIQNRYVLLADFKAAAQELAVELPAIQAVAQTESKGAGFFTDGSCAILFERHWMYQNLLKTKAKPIVDGLSMRYPNLINPTPGGYLGGIAEYGRLNQAASIDRTCALLSASWGMFQIMGFNFTVCGYSSVEAYVADMKLSEKRQLAAFVTFIKTYRHGILWAALKNKDWVAFATAYNGTAQVADYSGNMKTNYDMFVKAA